MQLFACRLSLRVLGAAIIACAGCTASVDEPLPVAATPVRSNAVPPPVETRASRDKALLKAATQLVNAGQWEQAAGALRSRIRQEPVTAELLALLGQIRQIQGRERESLGYYVESLRMRPSPAVANNLAWILATSSDPNLRDGEAAAAIAMANCIDTQFEQIDHLDTLAAAYAELGRIPEAIEVARRALALEPSDNNLPAQQILDRIATFEKSRPIREVTPVASSREPLDPEACAYLGQWRSEQGREAEAIACYRQALSGRKPWPRVANNLAWLLATTADPKLSDPQGAVAIAKELLLDTSDPDRLAYFDTLAAARAGLGEFEAAAILMDQALALLPPEVASGVSHPLVARRRMYADKLPYRGVRSHQTPHIAWSLDAWQQAIASSPLRWRMMARISQALATSDDPGLRDESLALQMAEFAWMSQPHPCNPTWEALAVAYAATGRFSRAKRIVAMQLAEARQIGDLDTIARWQEYAKLFDAELKVRAPSPSAPAGATPSRPAAEVSAIASTDGSRSAVPDAGPSVANLEQNKKSALAIALENLGTELVREGAIAEATATLEAACRENPSLTSAQDALTALLADTGDLDRALYFAYGLLAREPKRAESWANLGRIHQRAGRDRDAIWYYQQALAREGSSSVVRNNLAWLLATSSKAECREPERAAELARTLCRDNPREPAFLDTLAAAQASLGAFEAAIGSAQRAVTLFEAAENSEAARETRFRLDRYRHRLPPYAAEKSETKSDASIERAASVTGKD